MPAGRPTAYTPEMAARICDHIAAGKVLGTICKVPTMPARSTVYLWMREHEEFSDAYARAREERADRLVDEMVDIADRQSLDPNSRRVMIDARKWVAAKMRPKVYGDKLDVEHGGNVTVNLTGSDAAL